MGFVQSECRVMTAITVPPPVDLAVETKKGIIDGVKKTITLFHGAGLLDKDIGYAQVIHDPNILYDFIQAYKANPGLAAKIAVDKNGKPVQEEDKPLVCGVTLAQVQQLLVKTCARYVLDDLTREEEKITTATRTVTRFLFFKTTQTYEVKTGGKADERKVRELTRHMAFDWQLPLLAAYARLSSAHLMELESDILALTTAEQILTVAGMDHAMLKKAKQTAGEDFGQVLAYRPEALNGIAQWSKDMYSLYRTTLGDKAFDFFARDKDFFMVCASLDKPLVQTYGDVLYYIAAPNLEELQRLNIDKTDILLSAMKFAFGERVVDVLSRPDFAKSILRKLVDSLIHLNQEKSQLAVSAELTCKAIAPQVIRWLSKSKTED